MVIISGEAHKEMHKNEEYIFKRIKQSRCTEKYCIDPISFNVLLFKLVFLITTQFFSVSFMEDTILPKFNFV